MADGSVADGSVVGGSVVGTEVVIGSMHLQSRKLPFGKQVCLSIILPSTQLTSMNIQTQVPFISSGKYCTADVSSLMINGRSRHQAQGSPEYMRMNVSLK